MPKIIEPSTLRILNPNGKTVGTGFLVATKLAVTCAHVITDAEAIEGDTIQVQFTGQDGKIDALVDQALWRNVDNGDVAFLRLDSVPDGIMPLRLASAESCQPGDVFLSFGYATAADVQGIHVNGKVDGYLSHLRLLQLQSAQANKGISGAPVLDEKWGTVLGMITKGHTELGRNQLTTFATASETIWHIHPGLKPVISSPVDDGPYTPQQIIQNYLKRVIQNNCYLYANQHLDKPVELSRVFSMLNVREMQPIVKGKDKGEEKPNPPIPFSRIIEMHTKIILLGEAGSGKSTLLQHLALQAAEESIQSQTNAVIPILLSLRSYNGRQRLDDVIVSQLHLEYVPETEARDWLNSGKVLILLDGLDEVVGSTNRSQVVQAIQQFVYSPYGRKNRLIVTSRLAGYLESPLLNSDFVHCELQTFYQVKDAQEFLLTWLTALQGDSKGQVGQVADAFAISMQAQNGSLQISYTPLLLRLAASAYNRSGQILTDRAKLYQEYIKALLEISEQREKNAFHFAHAQLEQGLESLAWAMQTIQARGIEKLADEINRENHDQNGLEIIRYIQDEIGLLRIDYEAVKRDEIFGFIHQSFQDYLVGKGLAIRWKKDETETWHFLKPRLHHHLWYDSIFFMAAQLDIGPRTRLVQKILNAKSLFERPLCRDFLLAAAICRSSPVEQFLQDSIESQIQCLLRESTFRYKEGAGFDIGDRLLVLPVGLGIMVAFFVTWWKIPASLNSFLDSLPQFLLSAFILIGIMNVIFSALEDNKLRWLVNPITAAYGRRKFSLLNKRIKALLQGSLQVVIETEKGFKISEQTRKYLEAAGVSLDSKASEENVLLALNELDASPGTIDYLFKHLKNNYVECWGYINNPDEHPIAEEAMRLLVYFGARCDLETNLKIAKKISFYLADGWSATPDVAYQAVDQLAARIAELEISDSGSNEVNMVK